MIFAASGTMQWAWTSTVLIRLPAITTSQRLAWVWVWACAVAWLDPPPELALAPAVISQPVKTRPPDIAELIVMKFLPRFD